MFTFSKNQEFNWCTTCVTYTNATGIINSLSNNDNILENDTRLSIRKMNFYVVRWHLIRIETMEFLKINILIIITYLFN
jgi:hypothetical protein